MSFLDDFIASTSSLPGDLQQNYSLIRQLDEQQRDLQRQMHGRCAQGLEEIKQAVKSGVASADGLALRYSSNMTSVHKTCMDVANEKVALAVQTYDMVDSYIQRLDMYLKRYKEEYGQTKESIADDISFDSGTARAQESQQDLDLPVDPNEPTYCYCNQVSYGEMIACDNSECKIEWFHFDCVGIKERPKGKWYCTDCSSQMKRRRAK